MKHLSKLFLFIHPMPYRRTTREEYMAKWEQLIAAEGPDESNVICILANELKEMELLRELAQAHFKERCVIDPDDYSVETKALLADDLQRTFEQRGSHTEWLPYEMWTSSNARRWTEGLKKGLDNLGFTYDPEALHMVTCGQEWGGCQAKYSMFMSKYLGLTRPPDVRADLSPDAGFPLKATFVERVEMDRHVYLFLFRMPDGRPMGQYVDGLRAVWEFPHIATVPIDPSEVEIVTTSPNSYVKVDEASRAIEGAVIADVGDGCHPARTALIGNEIDYEAFRALLVKAKISPWNNRSSTEYMVNYLEPVTTCRGQG